MKVALMTNPYNRVDLFEQAGFEVDERPARSPEEMIDLLKDADGALVNTLPLTTREVMDACPRLKVLSRMGVGVDSIDLDAATELGILACNVPGVNTTEVADHAMALLLSLTRCVPDAVNAMRRGAWANERGSTHAFQTGVRRIAGHVMGILGFGNIGRAFANRIRGFGPTAVIAYDPYVEQSTADIYGVRMTSFDEFLSTADFITVHCSGTKETRHLINAEALKKMKPTALLVNTSRGPVVDGTALAEALEAGEIQAAALDVTEREPISPDDPLLKLPNAFVTPHIAGFSPTFLDECSTKQAENVIFALTGKAPHGLANPEVIKTIAVMRSNDPGRWANVPDFSTALAL